MRIVQLRSRIIAPPAKPNYHCELHDLIFAPEMEIKKGFWLTLSSRVFRVNLLQKVIADFVAHAEEALLPNQVVAVPAGVTELLAFRFFFFVPLYIYIYIYILYHVGSLFQLLFLFFLGGVRFPPIWQFSVLLFWSLYKKPSQKKDNYTIGR